MPAYGQSTESDCVLANGLYFISKGSITVRAAQQQSRFRPSPSTPTMLSLATTRRLEFHNKCQNLRVFPNRTIILLFRCL